MRLAVIGRDVSRSQSPRIHTFLLEKLGGCCTYHAISVPPEEFAGRIAGVLSSYDLLNVTMPYKGEIVPYLCGLEGDAALVGAVNTVLCGKRMGYNTDGAGFSLMLASGGISAAGKRTLVLGMGGAGRSVSLALLRAGADVVYYERTPHDTKKYGRPLAEGDFREGFSLVVNCTGVGMSEVSLPNVCLSGAEIPIGELFCGAEWAVDLIYEPAESAFLARAGECGCRTLNGAAMLFYQAYFADCLLLGRPAVSSEAVRLFGTFREVSS